MNLRAATLRPPRIAGRDGNHSHDPVATIATPSAGPCIQAAGLQDRRAAIAASVLFVAAAALWMISLHGPDPRAMTDLGLISIMPPTFYGAFAVLAVGFGVLLPHARTHQAALTLYVILLIFIVHATAPILYDSTRYAWAWKHVGIVDYIQRHHSVDPEIRQLAVYHNWPGFFALAALLTEIARLDSPIVLAQWGPVFFNLIDLGALLIVMRALTNDPRLVWFSVWLYFLTNWVGQDYFAPQAFTYFLYLAAIGVCLTWFKPEVPPRSAFQRCLRAAWLTEMVHALIARSAITEPRSAFASPGQRLGLLAIVVLCMFFIAASHQLTPIMTIMGLTLLVVFQRCGVRSLPVLMTLLTMAWAIYPAGSFVEASLEAQINELGSLTTNAWSTLIDLSEASPGQVLVALVTRGLTAAVWGLALLGALYRLAQGHRDLSAALLAAMPFLGVAVFSYGGEILFRVYLFSLPFMVFFVAMLLRPVVLPRAAWIAACTVPLVSAVIVPGLLFAHFGKDRGYFFSPDEIAAAQFLYGTAPAQTLLIEGAGSYPWQFMNYEHFEHVLLSDEPPESKREMLADPVNVLASWLDNDRFAAAYIVLTRSQQAQTDMLGQLPQGALDQIRDLLSRSRHFDTVYAGPDAAIFALNKKVREGTF